MDWDLMDALTMIPGIVGTHYLAWTSDDFVYRIAVLSWGWCCACSMAYHLSNCDLKLRYYDLRAQWVSQVFMILETPQYSWPIILGGLAPVDWRGRMILNALGALYFVHHIRLATILLTLAYVAYIAQFPTKKKWFHSVFHLLLHWTGAVVALSPIKKYTLTWVHPDMAWLVFIIGTILLLPDSAVADSLQTWANNLVYTHSSWFYSRACYWASQVPKRAYELLETYDRTHLELRGLKESISSTMDARPPQTAHPPDRPRTPTRAEPDTPETLGRPSVPEQTPHPAHNDT
jgi:hypothetical protein